MFKTINGGKMPQRGSKYSACVDLFANEDCTIWAGETKVVGLGVCIDLKEVKKASDRELCGIFGQRLDYIIGTVDGDEDYVYLENFKKSHYLQLMLRSSLGKKGLILPNGVGVIDLDYPDEIKMIVHNPIREVFYDGIADTWDISGAEYRKTFTTAKGNSQHFQIHKGDKIAQITLLEHKSYLFGIDTDKERTGGIGSTGE